MFIIGRGANDTDFKGMPESLLFGGLQFTVGVVVILTEGYDGVVVIVVIIPNGCDTGILGVVVTVPKRCGTVVDVVVVLKGCCTETYCSLDVIGGVVDDIVGVEVISGKYGGGRNIG